MPKVPRDVGHDRLVRFLLRQGWAIRDQAGARHTVLVKNGEHVAVPRHDVLKTGTAAAILKQCGIPASRYDEI